MKWDGITPATVYAKVAGTVLVTVRPELYDSIVYPLFVTVYVNEVVVGYVVGGFCIFVTLNPIVFPVAIARFLLLLKAAKIEIDLKSEETIHLRLEAKYAVP